MIEKKVRDIIVIGAGIHFRTRHYVALCNSTLSESLKIHLLVDLKSEEEKIRNFFSDKKIKPEKYLFLSEENRNHVNLDSFSDLVFSIVNIKKINGALICTEPKVHKAYIIWAIKNNLNIFCDKPLTAFHSIDEKHKLYEDYKEIQHALSDKKLNFVLCCDRRAHVGYQYIRNYVSQIIQTYGVPITYIGIHYGDGVWNMPDEYLSRENHPHKYGYGVLLHSGYHYVDLLMSFVSINRHLFPFEVNDIEIYTLLTTPNVFLKTISNKVYKKCFGTNRFEKYFQDQAIQDMKSMGETDALIMGRFNHKGQILTNFNLTLLEATATKRSWDKLPQNLYLMNGRMHLENLIIHIGPLCSIEVNINHFIKQEQSDDIEDFSVTIMKNSDILKSPALTCLTRKDFSHLCPNLNDSESMNIKSRAWQLIDFLEGGDGNSSIDSHRDSVFFLNSIFKSVIPYPYLSLKSNLPLQEA